MDSKNKSQCDGGLRLRLLKTAAEIISKEGIKKLTLRSLGRQVGVSRSAPYRHFKNKDTLLLSIAEEGFNELTAQYQKINQDKSMDAFSRLQNIGLTYIEFAIRNPDTFKLMFGHDIIQNQRHAKLCSAAREAFSEYLSAVKTFQEENNIVADDCTILANYSWAAVHGLATLLIDGQIQVSGKNYGLPTLMTDDKINPPDMVESMLVFSKQTIANFWDMVLRGAPQSDSAPT